MIELDSVRVARNASSPRRSTSCASREIEARKVLGLHYGVTVVSRAYRRSKSGSGIVKVKKAIKKAKNAAA